MRFGGLAACLEFGLPGLIVEDEILHEPATAPSATTNADARQKSATINSQQLPMFLQKVLKQLYA